MTRAAVADLRAGRVRDVTVEKRFLRKDGEVRWIALALSALPSRDGHGRLVGVVTDVTDRRRAEAASAAQQAFLDAVLQSLSDGVVACDAEGRLTLFNRATREFHGLPETPVPAEQWATHYSLFRADGTTPLPTDEVPLVRALRGEIVRGRRNGDCADGGADADPACERTDDPRAGWDLPRRGRRDAGTSRTASGPRRRCVRAPPGSR